MNNIIFDLVTRGGFYPFPKSKYEEKLEQYKDYIEVDINSIEELNNYIETWVAKHKFDIISDTIVNYDLEYGYAEREVIYTLDGKYYKLYYFDCCYEYELAEGPLEVYPVEKIITEYVEKE